MKESQAVALLHPYNGRGIGAVVGYQLHPPAPYLHIGHPGVKLHLHDPALPALIVYLRHIP